MNIRGVFDHQTQISKLAECAMSYFSSIWVSEDSKAGKTTPFPGLQRLYKNVLPVPRLGGL